MDRLKQLGEAADGHEQALAMLNLGNDIKAAQDEAQRNLADADEKGAEADKVMAQASSKLREADDYAENTKSAADAAMKDAKAILVAASEKHHQAETELDDLKRGRGPSRQRQTRMRLLKIYSAK